MGDWEALRVSGGVATFGTGLAVAYLIGFLEKSKKRPLPRYHVKLTRFPTFSEYFGLVDILFRTKKFKLGGNSLFVV